ncbi:hypothetical protein D3C75_875660 [compost metagenome]
MVDPDVVFTSLQQHLQHYASVCFRHPLDRRNMSVTFTLPNQMDLTHVKLQPGELREFDETNRYCTREDHSDTPLR